MVHIEEQIKQQTGNEGFSTSPDMEYAKAPIIEVPVRTQSKMESMDRSTVEFMIGGPVETTDFGKIGRIYICWGSEWSKAIASMVQGLKPRHPWKIPVDLEAGDLLVMAVPTSPPAFCAMGRVNILDARIHLNPERIMLDPIPLKVVNEAVGLELDLATDEVEEKKAAFVETIVEMINHPQTLKLAHIGCASPEQQEATSLVLAAKMIRDQVLRRLCCVGCGSFVKTLEGHYFALPGLESKLDLNAFVESMSLVCADCHAVCHVSSALELSRAQRPRCPACRAGNPRQYVFGFRGRQSEPEDYIAAGINRPSAKTPQFKCRNCSIDFSVEQMTMDRKSPPGFRDIRSGRQVN